jgi:hypothetical protein
MKFNWKSLSIRSSRAVAIFGLALLPLFQNCSQGGFSTEALNGTQVDLAPQNSDSPSVETPVVSPPLMVPPVSPPITIPPATTPSPAPATPSPAPATPSPAPATNWPSWRKNMKAWEWKKIEGSDISLVTPTVRVPGSLNSRIDAWTGLATDTVTNKMYSAANGGHADYSGNEVYEIDLTSENPTWRLLREPTPESQIIAGNGSLGIFNNYYKDGRPSSTHTYYALQFISSRQSVFKFGAGSTWGTGNEGNLKTDSFSLSTNDWVPAGTWPDITTVPTSAIGVSICKNPLTEEVYLNNDRIRKFNPSNGIYSALAPPSEGRGSDDDYDGGCAVDTKRNKILFFKNNYRPVDGALIYDIATDKITGVSLSGPALRNVRDSRAGYGYYDPAMDAYIFKDHRGSSVYRIDPITYTTNQIATTGGETMPDAFNGVYTRFAQLPNLKGYAMYPKHGSGIWFLATQ